MEIVFSAVHQRADALGLATTARGNRPNFPSTTPQFVPLTNLIESEAKTPTHVRLARIHLCAESLLDEPTEFICGCGGDIVQRVDEEDLFFGIVRRATFSRSEL